MTNLDQSAVPNYPQMMRLDGRNFVVIGGGQGIGRQAAHALTQAGARVTIVGRSRDMTVAVADEVHGFACLGDATQRTDVERIFAEAAGMMGGVHGVVDSLGMVRRKALQEFTDEDWAWQFDIVLRHALLAIQIGGKAIADHGGGSMVFVGSTAGMSWSTCHGAYGAAKAALNQLVSAAAMELAPRGVRVNVVAPAVVRTPRVQGYLDAGRGKDAAQYYPLGRLAVPSDIASAILFMATDLSRNMTGQTLLADGGLLAQSPMPDSVWF